MHMTGNKKVALIGKRGTIRFNRSTRTFKVKPDKLRWRVINYNTRMCFRKKTNFAKVDSLKKALFLLALPRYLLATVGDMANKFKSFNFNLSPTSSYPPFVFAGSY